MTAWLLVLLLAPTAEPAVLWHFPGPRGAALREAAVAAGAEAIPGHRVTAEGVDAFLGAVRWPESLGCLDDTDRCADPARTGLALVGAAARIDATAERTDGGFRVTLRRVPAEASVEPTAFTGDGPTLEAATAAAVAALRGTGTLRVSVTPPEARLFVDDAPLGQGPGDYAVPPGEHRVRAEADGFRPAVQPARVVKGETVPLVFALQPAVGRLELRYTPAHARATLDGLPLAKGPASYEVEPGPHTLRLEAEGYETYEEKVDVPAGGRLKVQVDLGVPERGLLGSLPPPHPDTQAHGYYVRGGLRLGSLASGDVDAAQGRGADRVVVDDIEEGTALTGLDLAAGWRGRLLTVEILGVAFISGGDAVPATLGNGAGEGTADDLGRIVLRPGWVGARYPLGRFEPYAIGGLELVLESFEVEVPASAAGDTRRIEIDDRLFLLGIEIGTRYHLTPAWFLSGAATFDFFPGERASGSVVFGVGYALELPEGL